MFNKLSTFVAIAAAFTSLASAASMPTMPTISAVGAKFFFSNGTQYYIKGEYLSKAFN